MFTAGGRRDPRVLAAGIFDFDTIAAISDRLAKRDPNFARALRIVDHHEQTGVTLRTRDGANMPLSDLVLTLRTTEVPRAYALGLAVGLQIGGVR
ncbi:MAG: hypothetical protein LC791_16190 [Acidobacteria bacterium]|nr:hypothetical protein [Acidobacteriota bacterium]